MKSRVQAWIHVALGAFLALAVLGGWEVASIASAASPTLISGCYTTPSGGRGDDRGRGDESTGALRIVRSSSDCRRGETFIQWNQAGQPGPAGVSGPAGPQGPAGALPNVSCPPGQFLTGIASGVGQCGSPSAPPSGYVLSVLVQGDGMVTSTPPGISCKAGGGGVCAATFGVGTTVDLLAQPATGAAFLLWSGAGCSGSTVPLCSVVMTSARNLTADFSIAPQAGLLRVIPDTPIVFGAGATKTYQVTNAGTAASGSVTVTVPSPNFRIVTGTNTCQGTSLAVGASCTFALTFTLPPDGFPVYWEESAITIEAPNAPTVVVAIYAEYPYSMP
jgi:hypothetical protein